MKNKKLDIIILIVWLSIALLIFSIKLIDVKLYEITNSYIGLYSINKIFLFTNNKNIFFEIISNFIFIFCLIIILLKLSFIFYEYVKNKKVSKTSINFTIHFIIMILIWIIFDKIIIINYRPILINYNLEGSFPSTHVMLSTFILLFLNHNIKNKNYKSKIVNIIIFILIVLQSISRILLQVHWFTDVLGGLLIGILLFLTYLRRENGFNINVSK